MFGDECLGVGEFDRSSAGDLGEHPDPYLDEGVLGVSGDDLLEDLAGGVARKRLGADLPVCRHLVGSKGLADERRKFVRGDNGVVEGHDVGLDLLAELAVIDPEHDDLADGRVFVEPVLDLDWIDVLATSDDEIGAAAQGRAARSRCGRSRRFGANRPVGSCRRSPQGCPSSRA